MNQDDGLRIRSVVQGAIGVGLLAYLVLRLLSERGIALPRNSWLTLAVLIFLAAPLLVLGRRVHAVVRGSATEPISPQLARGVLVAARAAAVAGGVAAGWYLAQAAVRLPNADIASQRPQLWLALALALASAGLSAAGLVVQDWCRIPPSDEDDPDTPNGAARH